MNRQIRQLAFALMALYVTLFVALNYWQVDRTDELASQPGNTRARIREFNRPRGEIITADGVVVACSREIAAAPFIDECRPQCSTVPLPTPEQSARSDVTYQRLYPTCDLFAQVVGYSTFGLGSTQIERTRNDVLVGNTLLQQVGALDDLFNPNFDISGTVRLTLREDMQRLAKFLLGPREGAIVMTEVATGAVTAMWSWPSFDPNLVAQPSYDAAFDYLTELQADPGDPLLANAYQQRYMPGSTFKVLTTGAGLDAGVLSLDRVFENEREYLPPQTTDPVENYGGGLCGGDLTEVFARSCNTPFARTAIELGPERFQEFIARWGVGEALPIDLPGAVASTIGDFSTIDDNLPLLAMRGFGQNEDQMVPLHMAMVAATVANHGDMMRPYVVDVELDHEGNVLDRTRPEVWKRPISRQTAGILQGLMRQVAETGTASCCIGLDGGIPVAAKTGTAQLNGPGEPERSHAWIVAYAPADAPRYAVAVMIEGTNAEISAQTGGRLAGPIAKAMLDGVFAADGITATPQDSVP
ncbi:MAG TPA: penicillin-binding transpeptidase domain-containing protein [Ilumatobacter sp.]|nr:penicillin-binding transpeptidase domain-containing protein [Ilumatobacter sp.]